MLINILVFCYKHGALDRRKKLTAELEKVGVLFESRKLKDTQLPGFIASYLKRRQVEIEPKASEMMAEFVGTDLNRMAGELEKLIITLPKGQRRITPEQIEQNIGISKDFNNFELRNALIVKDVFKANRIVKYFEENPKHNPLQVTLAVLFNFFANLMLAYYAPQKNEEGVAAQLSLRSPWQARDYLAAMKHYSGVKVMKISSKRVAQSFSATLFPLLVAVEPCHYPNIITLDIVEKDSSRSVVAKELGCTRAVPITTYFRAIS